MYETLNMGTILEPKSLQTKEQHARHWVFLVEVGARIKVWTWAPHKCPGYKRQYSRERDQI